MVEGYREHEREKDRKMAYYLTWLLSPYTKDAKGTYEHIYYGIHKDEEPSDEEKKAAFMKQFNL